MKRSFKNTRYQRGQSMVEYVVILMALSAALLAPGLGSVGLDQDTDRNSLLHAVANKHRGHMYALSLSEIPETDDLDELTAYYDSLDKYQGLSGQMGGLLANINGSLNRISNGLNAAANTICTARAALGIPC